MSNSDDYISVTGYDDILSGSGLGAVSAGNVGFVTIDTTGTAPVSNVVGQTWYDTSTGSLNVNTGSGYSTIPSPHPGYVLSNNTGNLTSRYSTIPSPHPGYVLTNNTGNLTIGQTGHVWANVLTDSTTINSKLVIKHNGKALDVGEAITMLIDRLCIIEPSLHLHEKYPALKEAYDAYKAIEAMCKAGDTDE